MSNSERYPITELDVKILAGNPQFQADIGVSERGTVPDIYPRCGFNHVLRRIGFCLYDPTKERIVAQSVFDAGELSDEERIEWLNHIVRACNSYRAMREALQIVIEHFNKTDATHDCNGRPVDCSMVADAARQALAAGE